MSENQMQTKPVLEGLDEFAEAQASYRTWSSFRSISIDSGTPVPLGDEWSSTAGGMEIRTGMERAFRTVATD